MTKKLNLNKKEPLLLNDVPQASNNLNSRSLFFQRKLYEKMVVADEKVDIDLWYEKPLYGKINELYQAIHLSESKLKSFPDVENVLGINFVVDAFEDFRGFFKTLSYRGAIDKSSPYYDFQAVVGWKSLNSLYHQHMLLVFERFKRFLYVYKKEKEIKDFESFLKIFVQFVDVDTPYSMLTRTKFVLSKKTSPLITGLIVEIAGENISEDEKKIKEYMADANYLIFKNSAMRYGFKVDKQAPWRLVADINSPALKKYIEKYNLKSEDVIDRYYHKTSDYDLEILSTYVTEFYNSYISTKPYVNIPELKVSKGRTELVSKEIDRSEASKEDFSEQIWLRLYLYIRAREENVNWNQEEFEKRYKEVYQYYISKGKEVASNFVNTCVLFVPISQSKERGFNFLNHTRTA